VASLIIYRIIGEIFALTESIAKSGFPHNLSEEKEIIQNNPVLQAIDTESMSSLIDALENGNDIDTKDSEGYTALMHACFKKKLRYGKNINRERC
jgi:hypothetical protein